MKKFLNGFLGLIQAILIIALAVLENLTKKKAGVNHHLHYKRSYHLKRVLKFEIRLVLAILLIVLIIYLCYRLINHTGKTMIEPLIWSVVLVIALLAPAARKLMVYPYMILVLFINLLISLIRTRLIKISSS